MRVALILGLTLVVSVACGDEPAAQVPAEATVEPLAQEQGEPSPKGDVGSDTPLADAAEASIPTASPKTEEEQRGRALRENVALRREFRLRGLEGSVNTTGLSLAEQNVALSERLTEIKLQEAQQQRQLRIELRNKELRQELNQLGVYPASISPGPVTAEQNLALGDRLDQLRLQEAIERQLTPTPVYWPTIDDFRVITSEVLRGLEALRAFRVYDRLAAGYVARECLDGGERTFARFRSHVQSVDLDSVTAKARLMASQIISTAEQLISRGQPVGEWACRPFVLPVTVDETLLSVHLLNSSNPSDPFYQDLLGILERRMYKCIADMIDDKEEIFLRCMFPAGSG